MEAKDTFSSGWKLTCASGRSFVAPGPDPHPCPMTQPRTTRCLQSRLITLPRRHPYRYPACEVAPPSLSDLLGLDLRTFSASESPCATRLPTPHTPRNPTNLKWRPIYKSFGGNRSSSSHRARGNMKRLHPRKLQRSRSRQRCRSLQPQAHLRLLDLVKRHSNRPRRP